MMTTFRIATASCALGLLTYVGLMGVMSPSGARAAGGEEPPEVLELTGIEAPGHVRGQSFAPLLRGEALPRQGDEPARVSVSWVVPRGFEAPAMTIRRNDLKVMRHRRGDVSEQLCFDLAKDPGEQQSVCEERAEEVSELVRLLERFEEEALLQRSALQGGDASPVRPAWRAPLDPDRDAELRALGYLD